MSEEILLWFMCFAPGGRFEESKYKHTFKTLVMILDDFFNLYILILSFEYEEKLHDLISFKIVL